MLVNLGVSHKKAPLSTLDALTLRDAAGFYRILKNVGGVSGALVLQTCNRVEFYLETDGRVGVVEVVVRNWALETRFKLGELLRIADDRQDEAVVEHLVRLGCGLESMLVGESQILGQLKNALAEARTVGATTPVLVELFDRAASAASKIREMSGMGRGAVSLGSAALRLAEETLGPLGDKRVLLIGTGQVGMMLMKALRARDVRNVTVISRTMDRAETFSRTYGGSPADFRSLNRLLASSELVIVATSSPDHLITREMVASVGEKNKDAKLMVLDLSSPRNVSPDIQEAHGVILRTIDDLRGIADESLVKRREIVKQAEPLVREKVENIVATLRKEKAEPIVSDIYRRADEVRSEEVAKALSKLKLTPDQEIILEKMSQSLVEKLLTPPVSNLRKAAEKGDSETLQVAGQIFGSE